MLFTSPEFVLLYLPVVLAGFFLLSSRSQIAGASWLLLVSLFFYAYWMPRFVFLLGGSICWNYWVGARIQIALRSSRDRARHWMQLGIVVNLLLLAYFKYANFLVENAGLLTGQNWHIAQITLPIGISFFTFTQIAFLADVFQKGVQEPRLIHYGLFVTYFPHLVAGPVLHHAQMMPQFRGASCYRVNTGNLAAGACIFALGLIKKVVLADGISPYADAIFNGAANGFRPDCLEAWIGALAYTFQLYFDFSGYSDMAIGLSWMLNIRLPYNFNSPYKARNIADFWRRWHMTLSAFLRDYLYIPLGGNRHGNIRRYVNLFLTMLLGGLWHGASWNFVLWGGLHGAYLGINHAFRAAINRLCPKLAAHKAYACFAWLMTFVATVVAWVFFRASSLESARHILQAMTAFDIHDAITHPLLWNEGLQAGTAILWCAASLALVLCLPNSNYIGERMHGFALGKVSARPVKLGAAVTIIGFAIILNATRKGSNAFIYFNF
jgi:alginate O-acetyltransferase complex protein AlgI